MSIGKRVKGLFHADVHAILDAIEEPKAVLKQAIREMEDALDQKREQIDQQRKRREFLAKEVKTLSTSLEEIEADLTTSIRDASEAVIRKLIGKKLFWKKQREHLNRQIGSLDASIAEREREIEHQQDQLASILEKAKLFVPAEAGDSPFQAAESILTAQFRSNGERSPVSDEEVEVEYLKLRNASEKGEIS